MYQDCTGLYRYAWEVRHTPGTTQAYRACHSDLKTCTYQLFGILLLELVYCKLCYFDCNLISLISNLTSLVSVV